MTTPLQLAGFEKVALWRKRPDIFAQECFTGFDCDEWWVLDFFRALADQKIKRIALKGAKGPGKSAVEAIAIWWFLFCQGDIGAHPAGFACSITRDNLKANLWRELAKWRLRSRQITETFEFSEGRIFSRDHSKTWGFDSRSFARDADSDQQSNALAGLHEDYTLVVLDEVAGMPDSVQSSAEGSLSTGKWNKIIIGGNPTHLEGPLYRACTSQRAFWHVITITGDPDDPKRSKRMNIDYCRDEIAKWGRDDDWVKVNVFNEFPSASINALFGPEEVDAAMARMLSPEMYRFSQKRTGCDVARFGNDKTVIAQRQGLQMSKLIKLRGASLDEVAARVAKEKSEFESECEFIDANGVGAGVVDFLATAGHSPISIFGAGKADDPRHFNKRTEMALRFQAWVRRGGALPMDRELAGQMTTITYSFKNGAYHLEEADRYKTRMGASPDEMAGVMLTFAWEDMPAIDPVAELERRMGDPNPHLPIRVPFGYDHQQDQARDDWKPY